jgi:hypothetical protein
MTEINHFFHFFSDEVVVTVQLRYGGQLMVEVDSFI